MIYIVERVCGICSCIHALCFCRAIWIKMVSFGWHLQAAEYTGLISPRSNSNC